MHDRKPDTRGVATRESLIVCALDLFGRKGFDGAGAREITATAGVPLASLPYHFGSKEALYRAAIMRVRDEVAAALAPAAKEAAAALDSDPVTARRALHRFQSALLDVMATDPKAASWSKLLLREHFDPGPAFDLVYDDAGRGAVDLIARLVAAATGRKADDPTVIIEAFARMGEVLIFRITQAAIVKRLKWPDFGPDQANCVRLALGWGGDVDAALGGSPKE